MHKLFQLKSIVVAVVVSAIFMVQSPVVHAESWSEQQTRETQQQQRQFQQEAEQRQQQQQQFQRDAEQRQQQQERQMQQWQQENERRQRR